MGPQIVGLIYQCGIYCLDCSEKAFHPDEMRYLLYGTDGPNGLMDTYPRLDRYGEKKLNKRDKVIVDKNVKLPVGHQVLDRNLDPVNVLREDDGDRIEGEYCEQCSQIIIEPYSIPCWDCHEVAVTGQKAIDLERTSDNPNGLSSCDIYCYSCVQKKHKDILARVGVELIGEIVRLRQGLNPIWSLFGKITGLDHCFNPRILLLQSLLNRVEKATSIVLFAAEIEQELIEAGYYVFNRPHGENADVLSSCLEAVNRSIGQFEDNDMELFKLVQLGESL